MGENTDSDDNSDSNTCVAVIMNCKHNIIFIIIVMYEVNVEYFVLS